jgi:hypothetical protein
MRRRNVVQDTPPPPPNYQNVALCVCQLMEAGGEWMVGWDYNCVCVIVYTTVNIKWFNMNRPAHELYTVKEVQIRPVLQSLEFPLLIEEQCIKMTRSRHVTIPAPSAPRKPPFDVDTSTFAWNSHASYGTVPSL